MQKPICIIRSVAPDQPADDFNSWAVYIYNEIRKQYPNHKPLKITRYANTLEKTN